MTNGSAALPDRCRVVIIGGGIVGVSVAYHLGELGWSDVILLEQGTLSCGTTWHAAGLLGQLRATENGTRLVQYSADLYSRLEAETGLATGYKRCGGVTVARTPDRLVQLQRTAAAATAYGLECELITPAQARDLYPMLRTEDLVGGLWLPGDGTANPSDVTASLAKGARQHGVRIIERVRVTGVQQHAGAVTGVRTDLGDIEAEYVVNCAGQWAKAVGALAGVMVPLHSAEHFYAVTERVEGVHRDLPILRDPDGYTYFKEEVGGLVVGGFEPEARPWSDPDQLPYPFEFQLLDDNLEHFSLLLDSAMRRLPVLERTGIKKCFNGPESFTPDNQFILGEAPELRNFFVGAGFNSVGIASAGGAGRALAEWIVEGEPTSDLTAVDIRRFAAFNGNNAWLRDRVGEVLGLHYEIPWPNRELHSARPFRRSPVHERLVGSGAVFGSKMGWERPNVFAPRHEEPRLDYTWGKPSWLSWCEAEQRATRSAVAVFDQTSFGKLIVKGRDACELLQYLCTADVDVPVGHAVYTGMLNARAGYEADVTVTRVAHDEYLVVTSAASPRRDQAWIEKHVRNGRDAVVFDVSAQYAVFGVMGPRSRELLEAVSSADFSDEGFPFSTSRVVGVGHASARATRITYVGELGWELYVPVEFAIDVYQHLMTAGAPLGVVNAGYYTINSLRLEKGYRAFGPDLTPDRNPLESGLLFTCKLRTDLDFVGRAALEKARAEGALRRLVSLVIQSPDAMLWGGELVLRGGQPVGQVASAAWSAHFNACLALAWVQSPGSGWREHFADGDFSVNLAGHVVSARVELRAPFDPDGTRIKG